MSTEAIKAIETSMQGNAPAPESMPPVAEVTDDVVEREPAATDTSEESTGDSATSDGNDSPARQNKGVGKRINELTKNWREEERKAAAEKQRADELQRKLDEMASGAAHSPQPQQAQAPSTDKPTLESCDYDAELLAERMADWKLDQRDRKQQEEKQKEAKQQRFQSYQQRADAFADEHPDYAELTEKLQVTPIMDEAIFETEAEPQIAYYLAQHPEEVAAIVKLSPAGQVRAIAKLEMQLSAPSAPEVPSIPQPPSVPSPNPPPPTVNAKSTVRPPVAAWNIEQHIEAVRAKTRR